MEGATSAQGSRQCGEDEEDIDLFEDVQTDSRQLREQQLLSALKIRRNILRAKTKSQTRASSPVRVDYVYSDDDDATPVKRVSTGQSYRELLIEIEAKRERERLSSVATQALIDAGGSGPATTQSRRTNGRRQRDWPHGDGWNDQINNFASTWDTMVSLAQVDDDSSSAHAKLLAILQPMLTTPHGNDSQFKLFLQKHANSSDISSLEFWKTMPMIRLDIGHNLYTIDCSNARWKCNLPGCMSSQSSGLSYDPDFGYFSIQGGLDKLKKHLYTTHHFSMMKVANELYLNDHAVKSSALQSRVLSDIPASIRQGLAVGLAGQKGVPFAACASTMDFLCKSLRTLSGGSLVPTLEISAASHAGHVQLANLGRAFNLVLTEHQTGGVRRDSSAPNTSALVDVTHKTIAKDTADAGAKAHQLLQAFFLACLFVTVSGDESTPFGFMTTPLFVVMAGISKVGWSWRVSFIGQGDAARILDGNGLYSLIKKIVDALNPTLFPRIRVLTSDGGSNMRSTMHYRGITAHGADGSSVVADFWRNGNKILALHCVPHQGNLALASILLMMACWIEHVRCMHGYFKKSVKRKVVFEKLFEEYISELRELIEAMGDVATEYPR
eukprot:SAG11_NODE_3415_length_2462_cov_2.146424_2_plen_611_part_00